MMHTTGRKGCQSELKVACDLSSRGYEIFVQFGVCSCDMIALRDGRALRIEVKSGYFRGTKVGKMHCLDNSRHDVMAIVYPTHIQYIGLPEATWRCDDPEAPEWVTEYIGSH